MIDIAAGSIFALPAALLFYDMELKICVFSDTHGRSEPMLKAVRREEPVLCFFLGDGERDLNVLQESFPELLVYAVRGNCDLRSSLPLELHCAVGGVEIFATHGHIYSVKHDPQLSELRDAAGRARVVLYGHTHIARCEELEDKLVLNPGSSGYGAQPGYGILLIEDGRVQARLRSL